MFRFDTQALITHEIKKKTQTQPHDVSEVTVGAAMLAQKKAKVAVSFL